MDDIVLPPMPDAVDLPEVIRNYARAAVIADRERRAEPASKKVHQATVYLGNDGFTWIYDANETVARPIIRWTNDGRVWIESADHREVAHGLRGTASWLQSQSETALAAICRRAANLLDGGESC